MTRHCLLLVTWFACFPAMGCFEEPRITVEDDLDFELFQWELHTPYVVGASVSIAVGRRGDARVDGWSAEVESPAIFAINQSDHALDGESFTLSCVALAPGETRLNILDGGGRVTTRRTIEVKMPDRVELIPAGLIKVRGDDAPPVEQGEPIRILTGGDATFEVVYYQGNERLFGNGALLASTGTSSLLAEVDQTYFFENREWLRLSTDATGVAELGLEVGGEEIERVTVQMLPPEAIHAVEIEAEPAAGSKDEALLYLLAHAYDADMNDLWGVSFHWAVDGVVEPGLGDLFYYYYDRDAEAVVESSVDGLSDEVVVFISGGGVTSSNDIGCSTAGGSEGLMALLVLLLFFTLRRVLAHRHGGR